MKVRLALVPILVALAATAVGCSDDSSSSAASSTTAKAPGTTMSSETIPKPDGNVVPGSACVTADSQTFAELALGVLSGADGARKSQQQAQALKAKLPADLADDLDTMAATFEKVADAGTAATTDLLDDPAYRRANDAVAAYFDEQCNGAGPAAPTSTTTTTTTTGAG